MAKGGRAEVIFDGYFEIVRVSDEIVTVLARPLTAATSAECLDLPAHAFVLDGYRLEPGAMGIVQKVFVRSANRVEYRAELAVGPDGAMARDSDTE
jgi:hypothetical protein